MIITPLGHTEFLIDIENKTGENIRILVDSWLSDYIVGDLMERSTKIQLDHTKLNTIDAIYLSHSHTDHIDPYTLVEIYTHANPILLLPYTLRYMESTFQKYIPKIKIEYLVPKKIFHLRGIEIVGYMFPQEYITNEDDVMMIGISNDTELLFAEIDTIPDEYDEDVQKELFHIFDRKDYETRCYLASRNELDGQLRIYELDAKKRKSYRSEYIAGRKEEMKESYEKFEYDEYIELSNIFTLPGFVRGFVGQGLQYPQVLSESLSRIAIFPLDEIVSMETDLARSSGYEFVQKALIPGRQYKVENATIDAGRKECPIGSIIPAQKSGSQSSDENRLFATKPLIARSHTESNLEESKTIVLKVLNTLFLPYWSASPIASLRSAMIKNLEGTYRIALKIENGESIIFEYSFAVTQFSEVRYTSMLSVDEDYWLSDILDFLDGKQELYSNFWHTLDPKKIYRLWTCLGANFCNNDLVLSKYNLHFARASDGARVDGWVTDILDRIKK